MVSENPSPANEEPGPDGSVLGEADVLALLYNEAKQTIIGWCREAERSAAELIASAEATRQAAVREATSLLEQAHREAEQIVAEAGVGDGHGSVPSPVGESPAGPSESEPVAPPRSTEAAKKAMEALSEAVDGHLTALEETMLAVASITSVVGDEVAVDPEVQADISLMRGRIDVLSESVNSLLESLEVLKAEIADL